MIEEFEVIVKNGAKIKVESCCIDTWTPMAVVNKLQYNGVKVSYKNSAYVLGFNKAGELFGSVLGKKLYKTALMLHEEQSR